MQDESVETLGDMERSEAGMEVQTVWHKGVLRSSTRAWTRKLWALVLPLLLCGCLVSKDQVFDPNDGVMPFALGKYKVEEVKDSHWVDVAEWDMKAKDNGYVFDDGPRGEISVRLFELDDDLYIVEGMLRGSERNYALARVKQGAIIVSFIDCASYKQSEAGRKFPPVDVTGGLVSQCYFNDNQKLYAGLSAFGELASPFLRLTPVMKVTQLPPAEMKPKPQPEAPPTTSLTLCNQSPIDVSAIVHHQHRFDASKNVLTGWYDIKKGQCRDVGTFPRAGLMVFGSAFQGNSRVEWQGKSKAYCVTQRQTYRVAADNERCVPGESAKQFGDVNAGSDASTYTFRWNGPR